MAEERVQPVLAMLTIEPAALGVELPSQELAALGPFFAERRRKGFIGALAIAEHARPGFR